jgi:hypothetical protein
MFKNAHLPELLLEQPSFRARQKSPGSGTNTGHVASNAVERRTEKSAAVGVSGQS